MEYLWMLRTMKDVNIVYNDSYLYIKFSDNTLLF